MELNFATGGEKKFHGRRTRKTRSEFRLRLEIAIRQSSPLSLNAELLTISRSSVETLLLLGLIGLACDYAKTNQSASGWAENFENPHF
jgi:hypothetical protein